MSAEVLEAEKSKIESNKADFSTDLFFEIRSKTRRAVHLIADRIKVGMLEEEANEIARAVLQELGTRQGWHPAYVRFGPNTIKSYGVSSDPGVRLSETDIYFIDIGPVWQGYEGDAGETFVTGDDPELIRCAADAKRVFEIVLEKWKTDRLTGEALYQFAEQTAQELGWVLNLDLSGHRLADFPHDAYYDGSLAAIPFQPAPKLWVLEIQIKHPEKPFGAFYEDLLI
jgi:methionyl aminopeptidase